MYNLFLTANPPAEETPVWLVCLLGIVVVFVGLLCIIGLVELMTYLCNKLTEKTAKPQAEGEKQAPVSNAQQSGVIENRGELIAAVCAAVAEENGTDISAIRVVSFKKIN